MTKYRIVIYSNGEVIEDREFLGFSLLTKQEGDDDDPKPGWHKTVRGLNDMESVGLHSWGLDHSAMNSHNGDLEYEGVP